MKNVLILYKELQELYQINSNQLKALKDGASQLFTNLVRVLKKICNFKLRLAYLVAILKRKLFI